MNSNQILKLCEDLDIDKSVYINAFNSCKISGEGNLKELFYNLIEVMTKQYRYGQLTDSLINKIKRRTKKIDILEKFLK